VQSVLLEVQAVVVAQAVLRGLLRAVRALQDKVMPVDQVKLII
jgi:hypothetical protein